MSFFKITDPQVLAQIAEQFQTRAEIIMAAKEFAEMLGLKHYAMEDDLNIGVHLLSVGTSLRHIDSIDMNQWKVKKTDNPNYRVLLPRKTNKKHCQFYHDNFPTDSFSYSGILSLFLNERYCPFSRGTLGYSYKAGEFFIFQLGNTLIAGFECLGYTLKPCAERIMESEYCALRESVREKL